MSDLINAVSFSNFNFPAGTDGTIKYVSGKVYAMSICGGASAGTVTLYDNDGTGPIAWQIRYAAASARMVRVKFPNGLQFSNRIYVKVVGAGCTGAVAYV